MNSRERILAAVEHREPDRVPVDMGSTPSSGISAIAYGNLKRHLGITTGHTRIYDVCQQVAQPEETILNRFGVDVVDIGRAFNTRDVDWYDVTLADGQTGQYPARFHPELQPDGSWIARNKNGVDLAYMPAGGTFFDQTCFPYLDGYPADYRDLGGAIGMVHWAAFAHSPWDHAGEPDFWNQVRQKALELRRVGDRALMLVIGCNLFEWGTFLRRLDNFLMDLLTEPEQVEALVEALMELHMAGLKKACEAVGDVADIMRFGDDLGTNGGLFMSPAIYRRFFKPHHAKLCAYVHKHTPMKTFLHSCGSIHAVLPDIIEAGFDIINPVQTNCRDMEPERLKKDFGKDVCFWGGGCDPKTVLNNATPAEVKDHVKRRLDVFMPGGGYVFNTVHNMLPEVPPQNIVAMFEAVREFGQ